MGLRITEYYPRFGGHVRKKHSASGGRCYMYGKTWMTRMSQSSEDLGDTFKTEDTKVEWVHAYQPTKGKPMYLVCGECGGHYWKW